MIAFIKGILQEVREDKIVIENNGMGYNILVPGSIIEELPAPGSEIKIYTYMHVREDAMQLFGFRTYEEKEMFKMLITVNGVGPKGALAILTCMDVDSLKFAIISEDSKSIAKSQGIGAKTASKVVLELKDKCDIGDVLDRSLGNEKELVDDRNKAVGNAKDAIEALMALGYSSTEASSAVRKVSISEDMTVDEILRLSLKNI